MRDTEGLYRTGRTIVRIVIGTGALAIAVVIFGFAVFVRPTDPNRAVATAMRELRSSVLRYGERPVRIARVYRRRPAAYFRGANGILAATPDRLLFVGIEPRTTLTSEDAPPSVLTSEFANDTLLALHPGRVYLLTAFGVRIDRNGRSETYAALKGDDADLDSLVAYVQRAQHAVRVRLAQEQALRAAVAALIKQPLRYEVRRGDAISTIASRFGTSVEKLREWNHLSSDRVRLRDTLLVRGGDSSTAP